MVLNASRMIDLTMPLQSGMRGVAMEPAKVLERDGWNARTLHLYSHAGTHMDAQHHFGAGDETIDTLPLDRCMGPCWVIRLGNVQPRELLTVEHVAPVCNEFQWGDSLLLNTGWSQHVDNEEVYRLGLPRISGELAEWMVAAGVRIVGVEAPSVADVTNLEEVTRIHRILLRARITIVEGLCNLEALPDERFTFIALPLRISGGDGSPCRAIAYPECI